MGLGGYNNLHMNKGQEFFLSCSSAPHSVVTCF